jgi:hypothetical protein
MEAVGTEFQGEGQVVMEQERDTARPANPLQLRRQGGYPGRIVEVQEKARDASDCKRRIEIVGEAVGRWRADQEELAACLLGSDGFAGAAHASSR